MTPSVHVITHFVSPYQVELFNAIGAAEQVDLFVTYLYDTWKGRHWDRISIEHPYCVARDTAAQACSQERVDQSDLVVFNTYRDRFAGRMIGRRARHGRPWVFWGERPAFRFKGRLGVAYRRWRLSALRRSRVPIWGIGTWAVEKYRQEFGGPRPFHVLPYYSDLTRFRRPEGNDESSPPRLLFSGALTARKGVDLLGSAVSQLFREGHDFRMTFVGTGELEPALQQQLAEDSSKVQFAGFQDWPDLPDWYHRADVLVAPSRYDGWGLIVPEGLAAGLPVVATDQMGAAIDLIAPGQNGWICPAGDLESLLGVLREVVRMPTEALRERRRQAELSVAEHQLSHGAAKFSQFCLEALAASTDIPPVQTVEQA